MANFLDEEFGYFIDNVRQVAREDRLKHRIVSGCIKYINDFLISYRFHALPYSVYPTNYDAI